MIVEASRFLFALFLPILCFDEHRVLTLEAR